MRPTAEVQHRKMVEQAQAIAMAQQFGPQLLTPAVPAGWQPDPSARHELRWWNGTQWTADVSDRGAMSVDPL